MMNKMPAESKPAKNGDVDPGPPELANRFRLWCAQQRSDVQPFAQGGGGSVVISHLGKCAQCGNARVKGLVATILKFLAADQSNHKIIVASGGLRTLLGLVDLEEQKAQDAARQVLAQICIVTNPNIIPYAEQLDAVRPLVKMMEHRHELLQFEGAMALTNLLTVSPELRSKAIKEEAWRLARDLLFIENERVQRAGLEVMCNLSMSEEIL